MLEERLTTVTRLTLTLTLTLTIILTLTLILIVNIMKEKELIRLSILRSHSIVGDLVSFTTKLKQKQNQTKHTHECTNMLQQKHIV